jgi:septal ring factor EnvC (AmiA/AmiB activator)
MKRMAFVFLPLAACAMPEPPVSEMTVAREMVAHARAIAAEDAPQDLATAQTKLAQAEAAMQREQYEQARLLAQQAEADAKLAWTNAEKLQAQRALREERSGQ